MRKTTFISIILALAWIGWLNVSSAAPAAHTDEIAWFQKTTQALFDAIAPGDKFVWDSILADNWIYTTEDGVVLNKTEFLKGLTPLPPGFSGSEKIQGLTVRKLEGVAVVHYWVDEQEDAYGEKLRTKYVETDTYRRDSDTWKMIAAQVTVVPRDLEPVKVNTQGWSALVGKYGLNGRASWPYYVFIRNGTLYGGRDAKSATQLIPLSPLVYYQKGSIHIMVFIRDAAGAVNQVLELHKYNEVALLRISKERTK